MTSEHETRHILVLDLGTSKVRALVCRMDNDGSTALGFGKEDFDPSEMQGGVVIDIARVVERCLRAVGEAQKQAGKEPESCVIGFSGESMKGQTVDIDFQRSRPQEEITLSELKHIIHEVQWSAFDTIRRKFAEETGHLEVDIKLISASVEHITIDGQFIANPLGFRGKDMKVSVYNCFAPILHYGALQTIGAELPFPVMDIVVQPYALSHALIKRGDSSCLVIDVGAGTTDVALIDGGLKETKSFAMGGRTFAKRLSFELNISLEEAEKVKFAYGEGKLDSASTKIVKEILDRDAQTWLMGLTICLSDLSVELLPSQVFLTGGGVLLRELEDLLRGDRWHLNLPFANYPTFSYLSPSDIPSFHDPKHLLHGTEHSALAALSLVSGEILGKDGQVANILRKIVQTDR